MMSREFRLPYFGPKKLPSTRKSIKPGDIPTPLNHLLPQVYTIINNRQRQFKRTERDRPQAWWRLVEHRKPTRWCLYRNLIKHAKWFDALHPSKIHPQSPILTNWIRSQFREHRSIRTVPHAQEILRQAYSLLTRLVNSKYGDSDDLNQIIYDRDQLLETQNRKIWGKVYKAQLDARRPPTPIMTGRFLRPSVLNGPLPRLAHQPLHISMMMSSRRKARERRMIEHRHLQEKLDTIRTESAFDSVLQPHHRNIFEQEHKSEVKGILDRLDVINNSFRLEKQRERRVYSRELLDKIEAARRRRPIVMAERNRWKRMKTRFMELDYVVQDDDQNHDQDKNRSGEGKRFCLPEPEFWTK
ncbi:hypothetical protein PSTG_00010 [Puccinia striiformis f. sp. tritici PST-78]|uniref:Uncharacterized protein n=1 Tax=Puccinia striiformis f. sp. tritici PST-78 TaxID=1165861 RepID=A0A0L0W599_9BASI|nr:hypothetical protein PSTG_00010 [Puccinia striiformis f. sp. tritici PST-78]